MDDASIDLHRAARDAAYSMPLSEINPADPELFRTDTLWPYFERLRKEDPVHWAESGFDDVGGYWSVTKYNDIMAVDTNHEAFSSEPTIVLPDPKEDFTLPMFIAMDPPKHDVQRKTVQPIVAPHHLSYLEPIIRKRAGEILDSLPIGETFNWVDKVSIELTTMTLATLFDFPWEDRRKLTRWSDVATASPDSGLFSSTDPEIAEQERRQELFECVDYFMKLWNERVNAPPQPDLISMLAHGEATRDMDRMEYLGNLILLIVGGNDTTRNTITGSVLALHQNPDQNRILRDNPALIPAMVSETIRWQTPLAYMRRTALRTTNWAARPSGKATSSPCGTSRATATKRSSTARTTIGSSGRACASTCRSASASTAAWATDWPNSSSRSSGRRSWPASRGSRWWARPAASSRRS